jgi:nucleotide-binding universal stress UspA family protein
MLRDLLVNVEATQTGRRCVQFAADLAVLIGARLSGIHVTPPADVPPVYKPSRVARAAADLSTNLALDARNAATMFREETQARLADACWFEAEGDVAQGVSNQARYADLVIVGQNDRQGPATAHPLPIAHSVVLHCGRPVLVVPAVVHQSALGRIAIAWDGSREAVRAVHDALPLLCRSQSVQIVTIIPRSAEIDAVDAVSLVAHLTNHGIKIVADVVHVRAGDERDALRTHIEQGHYDLLVMGGYSQARWLEVVFGGVTQSMLLSSKIPVLVSH